MQSSTTSLQEESPARERRALAFEQLVIQNQDRIYSLALRLLGDPEAARDVAQEAFCRALQGLRGFRRESSFSTWVAKITVNLCLSERRKNRVRGTTSLFSWWDGRRGDDCATLERSLSGDEPEPEDVLDGAERHAAVRGAIQNLEPDLRQVIVLRDMEGFSYQEVSQLLEIPIGTVRSRLHRARGMLRDELSPWTED